MQAQAAVTTTSSLASPFAFVSDGACKATHAAHARASSRSAPGLF